MKIISTAFLTETQLYETENLRQACSLSDGIDLSLFTGYGSEDETDGIPCFFMAYDKSGKLLAFLSMFIIDGKSAEITACTHPDSRKNGIFRALCLKAGKTAAKHGITHFIFAITPAQDAALKILNKCSAAITGTEYILVLHCDNAASCVPCQRSDVSENAASKPCRLIPAKKNKTIMAAHMEIYDEAFNNKQKEFIEYVFSPENEISAFSLTDMTDGNIIGCCYAKIQSADIMLLGICIKPKLQGKGFGKYMLTLLINGFLSQYRKPIRLHVSGSNKRALSLYKTLGFKTEKQFDYYETPIA